MTPMADIFRVEGTGVRWLETASAVEHAKARVQELGASSPGEYLILDQQTGTKHKINIDGVEERSGFTPKKKPQMRKHAP